MKTRAQDGMRESMRALSVVLIVLILLIPISNEQDCHSDNFQTAVGITENDYIIYGLTQDCQVFFARSYQLPLVASLRANHHNSHCYPNLVQFQLVSNKFLRLLIKQPGNRICVTQVDVPDPESIFGTTLFSYSLIASFPYLACSHASQHIVLEPDLAFPDSAYGDVIYFVDTLATGPIWNVRQYLLTPSNALVELDKLMIENYAPAKSTGERDVANEYVISLDTQKNYLFRRNRFESNFTYECAFDLLFRPHKVLPHSGTSPVNIVDRRWLNSMSIDEHLMLFAETDKQSPTSPTYVFAQNTSTNGPGLADPVCIAELPFRVEIGIMSVRTLKQLQSKTLPKFDNARRSPPTAVTRTKTTLTAAIITTKSPKRPQTPSTTRRTTTSRKITTTIGKKTTTTTERYVEEAVEEEKEQETLVLMGGKDKHQKPHEGQQIRPIPTEDDEYEEEDEPEAPVTAATTRSRQHKATTTLPPEQSQNEGKENAGETADSAPTPEGGPAGEGATSLIANGTDSMAANQTSLSFSHLSPSPTHSFLLPCLFSLVIIPVLMGTFALQ